MKFKNNNSSVKNFIQNSILIILSTIVTIYMIEIAYALYNVSSYKFKKWAKNNYNRYDVYQDEINKKIKTSVTITNNNHLEEKQETLLPLSGISNIRTIFCNELGFWTIYDSDKYGFNNSNQIWNKKNVDFVLIGDSFVHGACVKHKDSIAGQFENKGDVINLGYAGNGPLAEYATLKEYYDEKINSKYVIWFYYENDLQNLESELENELMKNYFVNKNFSQDLINKQIQLDELSYKLMEKYFKKHKKKFDRLFRLDEIDLVRIFFLKNIRHRISWFLEEDLLNTNLVVSNKTYDGIENLNNLEKVLINSKEIVERNGSKFIFVYLPQYPGIYENYRFKVYKKVIEIVKRNEINLVDLYENFSTNPDPKSLFPLRRYGHYNKKGYNLVVKEILKKVY